MKSIGIFWNMVVMLFIHFPFGIFCHFIIIWGNVLLACVITH